MTGSITELSIMKKGIECGCVVSIPFGNYSRYDQIWDYNNKLLKIQIKTARLKNTKDGVAICFSCYSVSNGIKHFYTKEEIDYFATMWNDKCYLIGVEECCGEKTLWLETYTNHKNRSLAIDYEIESVLKSISKL